jgi:hypothetical protein
MNKKQLSTLKIGDKVISRDFGLSTVRKLLDGGRFGIVATSDTQEGKICLRAATGMPGDTPFLGHYKRLVNYP